MKMDNQGPKISVIVPVYNVEQYLPRCIDSILAQTFTDFELLLIDDGSTDKSGDICDEYARKDPRIRVFHKPNGGVSSARNMGLDNAKGEWIAFVDSDDVILKTYLCDLIVKATQKAILVLSNYKKQDSYESQIKLDDIILENGNIVKYFIDKNILSLSAPYAKLYNSEIIRSNHLKFPIGIQMGEDAIFIMRYLNSISTVVVVAKCDYVVSKTPGSLSSKYYSFEQEWNCYKIWKHELLFFLTRFGKIYDNPIKILWQNRIGDTFNRCLQCLYRQSAKISYKEKIKCLNSIPISDIKEFAKYYQPIEFRKKLLKLLIVKRLFFLYILVGHLDRFK